MGSIPGSGRSPSRGHGSPLQNSCLENLMDRGAWWAVVHRVSKSWTQLQQPSMHTCILSCFFIHQMYSEHLLYAQPLYFLYLFSFKNKKSFLSCFLSSFPYFVFLFNPKCHYDVGSVLSAEFSSFRKAK